MKKIIKYQSYSGKMFDSEHEAIADDEDLIQGELNNLVNIDYQILYIIARYIMINFTRNKESE